MTALRFSDETKLQCKQNKHTRLKYINTILRAFYFSRNSPFSCTLTLNEMPSLSSTYVSLLLRTLFILSVEVRTFPSEIYAIYKSSWRDVLLLKYEEYKVLQIKFTLLI